MYYEFYIDVFFVVNLFMDFLGLCLTNQILEGSARPFRSLLGASLGAGGLCVLICLPIGIPRTGLAVYSVLAALLMVRVGCGFKTFRKLLMGLCAFYAAVFLLGGILGALPAAARKGILTFFTITFTAYWMLNIGIRLFKYLKGKAVSCCRVVLEHRGQRMEMKGLLDTGNCLVDGATGKPVCIMEYDRFLNLLEKEQQEALEGFCRFQEAEGTREILGELNPRFLLYTAVGCERGLLPVVTVSRLTLETGERKRQVENAALGLSKTSLSPDRKFEMIVSPKILES